MHESERMRIYEEGYKARDLRDAEKKQTVEIPYTLGTDEYWVWAQGYYAERRHHV